MLVKIHKGPDGKIILAVCDSNLINKKFSEENKELDLTTDFYKGVEKNKVEIQDLMRNSYVVNVVGEESIKAALEEELISEDNIIRIENIPSAQILVGIE